MTDNERFEHFIQTIHSTEQIWLLQAEDGLFAMVEDSGGTSYIPVWSSELASAEASNEEWSDYTVEMMPINEFINWCKELAEDDVRLGIEPDKSGRILPIEASVFSDILKQMKDN
ncbi:MAG: DUF2750 domain-containing protein [Bacteroidales bacterium]|nr:DUF2750 domain-containing protein [Bacteroidales bacterium]